MFEIGGVHVVLLDLTCMVLAALPFAVLTPRHNPFKRGFFCSDDSIRYPFREDTISYQLLAGIMVPLTVLVIVSGECLSIYLKPIKAKQSFANSYGPCLYKAVSTFLFGAAVSQSLTDIAKYTVGRLRPHFLDVCKPQWNTVDCKSGGYIESFTCTGDKVMVNESRLSFYSGHSSFSMYCMVFLALYLQARLQMEWSRLLRPTVQFFLIASSLYVGLSRISDYKHHWSDVVVGFLQGAVVAVLIVFSVADFFRRPAGIEEEQEISHTSLQDTASNGNHYGSTD
ncbi:phospholipid phosphatase 1-like [Engraulis encrasicolus]|uniref:phospholipid phosphatase 1-like n=1 Tax=Engraulis encrasicolus TaxID=184585 RepID=UPI002FD3F4F8